MKNNICKKCRRRNNSCKRCYNNLPKKKIGITIVSDDNKTHRIQDIYLEIRTPKLICLFYRVEACTIQEVVKSLVRYLNHKECLLISEIIEKFHVIPYTYGHRTHDDGMDHSGSPRFSDAISEDYYNIKCKLVNDSSLNELGLILTDSKINEVLDITYELKDILNKENTDVQ